MSTYWYLSEFLSELDMRRCSSLMLGPQVLWVSKLG